MIAWAVTQREEVLDELAVVAPLALSAVVACMPVELVARQEDWHVSQQMSWNFLSNVRVHADDYTQPISWRETQLDLSRQSYTAVISNQRNCGDPKGNRDQH